MFIDRFHSPPVPAGRHSVIMHPDQDDWYIVYRRRLGETDGNHRVTCIDKLEFNEDGRIMKVAISNKGVQINLLK